MDPFCLKVVEAHRDGSLQELMQSMDMNKALNFVTKLMSCMQKLENLEDDSVVNNERSPSSLSSSSPETGKKTRQVIIDVNEPVSEF
jgi:hypothetical protein